MNALTPVQAKMLRCAVYTRKSSEEGLEQSFNSLHAQREACEAYIKSQVSEGWVLQAAAYDDGGISGGTMERPGLKTLLADIAGAKIDVVVVYKVDRLTRSLGDFGRIIEQFDAQGVSFVSVTQAFNTTTSMGRLTLNVLLSFAQFEREVTGERIRDKLALSKAKGMWMGSVTPLGYDAGDHVLVPNPAEAETVLKIFRRYLELGSVHALCAELKAQGVRSKRWVTSKGRELGGAEINRGALFYMLQNRHYLGEIPHKGVNHPGLHAAIVDHLLFDAVQAKLSANRVVRRKRAVKAATHLFTGKVFDGEGRRFSPTFSTGRTGRIHRYYVMTHVQLGRAPHLPKDAITRIGAEALEALLLGELSRLCGRPVDASHVPRLVRRVEVRAAETHLVIDRAGLFGNDHPELAVQNAQARLKPGERFVEEPDGDSFRVALPRRMKLRGGRSWSAFAGHAPQTPKVDKALLEALQRAHALAKDPRDVGSSDYRRRLLRLALLSPSIQRRLVEGRIPAGLNIAELLRADPPLSWWRQESWFAGLAA